MRLLLILLTVIPVITIYAQSVNFETAYQNQPALPKGLLEAVSWSNTRMTHLENPTQSCTGMPSAYGIMGLFEDGANYFKVNGQTIATLSGISISQQKANPNDQINAYALAYEAIRVNQSLDSQDPMTIREVLHQLSEIPDTGYVNFLAKEMQVYQILTFMNSAEFAQENNFTPYHFDLEAIFGTENYKVLSSRKVKFSETGIKSNDELHLFTITPDKSTQYGPAIWNPAASCNFSSRNGTAVSAITIHTVQGTYAGCISWFQNCNASVSAHYVVRSSDGQITQMVLEEDKAWHVGSENPYTIGYEHEGYVDNPSWYTQEMYESSADLSRDIVNSGYGIPPLRTYYGPATVAINTLGGCTKIKGHQHYPNQTHTDPGVNWNWEKYYKLINNTYIPNIITSGAGTLTDSGGNSGDYADDERMFWLIQPSNVANITLNFSSFSLELNYDYLFIYDGNSVDATLIGSYTGTNTPGTITSSSSSILLEFRSDCSTTDAGWVANYTSVPNDITPPISSIITPTDWKTDDFDVLFTDTDAQGNIAEKYFVMAQNQLTPNEWFGLDSNLYETFSLTDGRWTQVTGTYQINSGKYTFSDLNEQNSNAYINAIQESTHDYLYSWDQVFTSNDINQRAGIHFFCDNATLTNRGNSYFVYLRESDDLVNIYKVDNDVFTLEQSTAFIFDLSVEYHVKVTFSPGTGWIKVYVNDQFVNSWQDNSPHQSGSAVSLRTGGCTATFDNLTMMRSRTSSITIPVGPGDEISVQSVGAQPTVKVISCSMDDAQNWSLPAEQDYLIDFTLPEIVYLNDGNSSDIDSFFTATIMANWNAEDIHSNISNYTYAIGTLPTLNNIVDWTNVNLNQSLSEVLSNPIYGQVYYISLKVQNGAGLSDQFLSNGQKYVEGLDVEQNTLDLVTLYPNPVTDIIIINGIDKEISYVLLDANGKIILNGTTKEKINMSHISSGTYQLVLSSDTAFLIEKIIKQ